MDKSCYELMFKTLSEYAHIPETQWEKALSLVRIRRLAKNDYFVRQGDAPDELAFIYSGIFRVFCITEQGDEKILSFRVPGQFLAAYTPFLKDDSSWYSIQALEPGAVLCIFLRDYDKLSREHPCWEKIAKEYIVRLFMEKESRERSFLTENARTRYLQFKNDHPELEGRIHQFYIASYLGISPVSLSRIRRELKESN